MKLVDKKKSLPLFFILIVCMINKTNPNLIGSVNQVTIPYEGLYLIYNLYMDKILSNGDISSIRGNLLIKFEKILNTSHINGYFEFTVDLLWIEGKDNANFTQNMNTGEMTISISEGIILNDLLTRFGTNGKTYNPVTINLNEHYANRSLMIWKYTTTFIQEKKILYYYKSITVLEYDMADEKEKLYFNANYEKNTGILIRATCTYTESTTPDDETLNKLTVTLKETSYSFSGEENYSSLTYSILLSIPIAVIPILVIGLIYLKKPRKYIDR